MKMYFCPNCIKRVDILSEVIQHYNSCYQKRNNMVYSDFRVPAHKQCKRIRRFNKCRNRYHKKRSTNINTELTDCLIVKRIIQ